MGGENPKPDGGNYNLGADREQEGLEQSKN